MGFSIGNLFKSAVNVLKPMAQVFKSVTPQAMNLLKGLVDQGRSAFDGIKNAATSLVSRLPGIGGLAAKLLGKGLDSLTNLGFDSLQKYLTDLLSKLAPRNVPGTNGTVTTPALPARAANAASEAARIASTSGAATAAARSTGGGGNIEDRVINGSAFNNVPEEPVIDGTENEKQLAQKQAQLQKYARMMAAITAFLQASHEMKKGIIQNFRV